MENKQLEEQINQELDKKIELTKGFAKRTGVVKVCLSITLSHMKGIAQFIQSDCMVSEDEGYLYTGTGNSITTEQLIDLYFESLNK